MNFGCGLREDQINKLEDLLQQHEAWKDGAFCCAEGLGQDGCPYTRGPLKREWLQGWRSIKKALDRRCNEA